MRVHFSINSITDKSAKITLLTQKLSPGVEITATKTESGFIISKVSAGNFFAASRVLRACAAHTDPECTDSPTSKLDVLLKNLQLDGGRQVVYDSTLEKYRNLTTMREGMYSYQATADGLEEVVTVEAKDEKQAASRVVTKMTALMTSKPELAGQLALWFATGRNIKEIASGKCPEAVDIKLLGGVLSEGATKRLKVSTKNTLKTDKKNRSNNKAAKASAS